MITETPSNPLLRAAGLAVAAVALAGAATTTTTSAARAPASPPAFIATIEREVPAIMRSANIEGAAVGLVVDGKPAYAKGFGLADHAGKVPVTADTVFVAASLSKPIAAWVAMRLAHEENSTSRSRSCGGCRRGRSRRAGSTTD